MFNLNFANGPGHYNTGSQQPAKSEKIGRGYVSNNGGNYAKFKSSSLKPQYYNYVFLTFEFPQYSSLLGGIQLFVSLYAIV